MNLKKYYKTSIIKAIITTIIITTSAYANEANIYASLSSGASVLMTNNVQLTPLNNIANNNITMLSKHSADNSKNNKFLYTKVALGYYFMDKLRGDISYTHLFNPKLHLSSKFSKIEEIQLPNGYIRNRLEGIDSITVKLNIDTIMANGFVNLYKINSVSFNVGLGLGISVLSGKVEQRQTSVNKINNEPLSEFFKQNKVGGSKKFKSKVNLALAGHLGVSFAATQNTHVDLTYSYNHFGAIKILGEKKLNLQAHSLETGIRFNF